MEAIPGGGLATSIHASVPDIHETRSFEKLPEVNINRLTKTKRNWSIKWRDYPKHNPNLESLQQVSIVDESKTLAKTTTLLWLKIM